MSWKHYFDYLWDATDFCFPEYNHNIVLPSRYLLFAKVELIWERALNQEFTGFPAKICIFKLRFCLKKTIKLITFEFKEVQ